MPKLKLAPKGSCQTSDVLPPRPLHHLVDPPELRDASNLCDPAEILKIRAILGPRPCQKTWKQVKNSVLQEHFTRTRRAECLPRCHRLFFEPPNEFHVNIFLT